MHPWLPADWMHRVGSFENHLRRACRFLMDRRNRRPFRRIFRMPVESRRRCWKRQHPYSETRRRRHLAAHWTALPGRYWAAGILAAPADPKDLGKPASVMPVEGLFETRRNRRYWDRQERNWIPKLPPDPVAGDLFEWGKPRPGPRLPLQLLCSKVQRLSWTFLHFTDRAAPARQRGRRVPATHSPPPRVQ